MYFFKLQIDPSACCLFDVFQLFQVSPDKDLESNVSFLQETCETADRHPLKFHLKAEGHFDEKLQFLAWPALTNLFLASQDALVSVTRRSRSDVRQ